MLRNLIARCLVLGLLLTFGNPAAAEPDKERPAKSEKKEKKGNEKKEKKSPSDARKQRLQQQAKRLEDRAKRLREEGKESEADRLEKRAQRLEKSAGQPQKARKPGKDARRQKKFQRLKVLQRRYGDSLKEKPVQQELSLHAERSARLERMKTLAEQNGKDELLERIVKLTTIEDERHEKEMAALTKKGDPAKIDEARAPDGPGNDKPATDDEEGAQ